MFNFMGSSSFIPRSANAGFIRSCPVNPDLRYLANVSSAPYTVLPSITGVSKLNGDLDPKIPKTNERAILLVK